MRRSLIFQKTIPLNIQQSTVVLIPIKYHTFFTYIKVDRYNAERGLQHSQFIQFLPLSTDINF